MDVFWQAIGRLLESEAFINLISMILIAIAAFMTRIINAKITNDRVKHAVSLFWDAIDTTVRSLQQTVVEDLKSKSEDGKLSPAAQTNIKSQAVATIKKSLTAETYSLLMKVYTDVDKEIKDRIEATVNDLHCD